MQFDVRDFVVPADDRTGAFEMASEMACADAPVCVVVGVGACEGDAERRRGGVVIDIDTRSRPGAQAAARAAAVEALSAKWSAHKIDSMLRGQWRAEIRERMRVGGRRALVVPAWPEMGRTCVEGVVHIDGRAYASVRQQVPDARLLRNMSDLSHWLAHGNHIAVCDVRDSTMLLEVADAVADADPEVLVVGPAGALGAVGRRRLGLGPPAARPAPTWPALVVCGSASDVAHEQLARLASLHPRVEIVADLPASGNLVPAVSHMVAARAATRLEHTEFHTVVVIGGATAAALLGDQPRLVGGTVLPGLPWSRTVRGDGPLVVTKAGAFGHRDTLVELFSGAEREGTKG
ncbi:MAG: four-carbon acid sugar kinase family protein [Actinomycetota bacterium]